MNHRSICFFFVLISQQTENHENVKNENVENNRFFETEDESQKQENILTKTRFSGITQQHFGLFDSTTQVIDAQVNRNIIFKTIDDMESSNSHFYFHML